MKRASTVLMKESRTRRSSKKKISNLCERSAGDNGETFWEVEEFVNVDDEEAAAFAGPDVDDKSAAAFANPDGDDDEAASFASTKMDSDEAATCAHPDVDSEG